jgi:hypothetical protein
MPKRLTVPLFVLGFLLAVPATTWARPRDRDHDRLPDQWEKRYHLSTRASSAGRDPDHDRLTNRSEYRHRTNPRRADTDRDGLTDYAEIVRWHTDPRRADTDGDGVSDGAEVAAGTDPQDPDSHPSTEEPPVDVGGGPGGGVCSGAANAAGGPDPWGGCWPGPQNTGVAAGVVLSPYGGPCTITTNGAVIDRALVNCSLTIRASGVQITNSKINGTVYAESPYSFSIADSEVDAGGPQNSGIGNENFTATRVHVHGGYRGIWCDRNCTVQDSWVHGQATDPSGAAHESGVRMGEGSIIRHNSLLCDAPDVPPDAGCSADLTGYGDFAPVRDNTIQRNLFLATTGGACAYGGSSGNDGSKPYGNQAANIVFAENIFQRRGPAQSSGKCGYWFPITDFDKSRPGNQWTNNQWADGGAVDPG